MHVQVAGHWRNWSGSVECTPHIIFKPQSIDTLVEVVKSQREQKRHIRVVGSGHSFTPLVQSNDPLLSLEGLRGIDQVDPVYNTVTVLGGTTLKKLGDLLHSRGLAQENLGDINAQTIAGSISTGTHGTGISFGSLSTQVEALTLITAQGELLECSPEQNADIFKAAQVSLGTLGVIARVKLRVVAAKRLHYKGQRETFDNCMTNLDSYKQDNTHFEFYWFPYTNWVQTKFMNETEAPVNAGGIWGNLNKIVLENGAFWLLSEWSRMVPSMAKRVSNISAAGIASVDEVDYSHQLFATPRTVRFQEMEYNIPAEHFSTVLQEIRACIDQHQFQVHFPIECRFVRADDIWLSPAYERESAYIAVHMYKGMEYKPYFRHIEKIFQQYQGRPHWGKLHTQNARQLRELYPRWNDFQRIRAELDPEGMFLNGYLRDLFGVDQR